MNLKNLTDKKLLSDMTFLAQRERALLSQVLWHLKEIDRRKLYSDLKCTSLFDYCVKVLKYSEGQASRRVGACRLLKELPEIASAIKDGELNLTELNLAKSFFSEEGITDPKEKQKVLDEIKNKNTRETEKALWEKRKNPPERRVFLSLKEKTVEELNKLKSLRAYSLKDMDELIMKMIELTKKEWDPTVVRRQRALSTDTTRYVQTGLRAQVWEKDKGKCRNCGSIHALQIDHIQPFSKAGKTEVGNLQLLCRNCNQRKGDSTLNSKLVSNFKLR